MVEVKKWKGRQQGIFATQKIKKGQLVFSSVDWVEDEKEGWALLSVAEIDALPESKRKKFLRYSYDKDIDLVIGTFNWRNAKHPSNFMNHCCEPNLIYDQNDNIMAKRDIEEGQELTIDYANFIVNMDQDFTCCCQSPSCRKRITKNDWINLIPEYGYNFPMFLHKYIDEYYLRAESKVNEEKRIRGLGANLGRGTLPVFAEVK